MTSISISRDRHSTTHWELQDDGSIFASSDGDGETVTAQDAFKQVAEALAGHYIVVSAETTNPPAPAGDPCGHEGCPNRVFVSDLTGPGDPNWDGFCSTECAEASDGLA